MANALPQSSFRQNYYQGSFAQREPHRSTSYSPEWSRLRPHQVELFPKSNGSPCSSSLRSYAQGIDEMGLTSTWVDKSGEHGRNLKAGTTTIITPRCLAKRGDLGTQDCNVHSPGTSLRKAIPLDVLLSNRLLPVPAYQIESNGTSTPSMSEPTCVVDSLNGLLDYGITGMAFIHLYTSPCVFSCQGPNTIFMNGPHIFN